MIKLRRLHLYLGCFFSPMLIFFVCTGWYQTMHPDRRKNPGEAEAFWDRLRSIHADSILPSAAATGYSTKFFRWLVVAMAIGFIVTVIFGVILAFRFGKQKWAVWLSLLLGVLLPVALLLLGQKH